MPRDSSARVSLDGQTGTNVRAASLLAPPAGELLPQDRREEAAQRAARRIAARGPLPRRRERVVRGVVGPLARPDELPRQRTEPRAFAQQELQTFGQVGGIVHV